MNAFIALLRKDLVLYFSNRRAVIMSFVLAHAVYYAGAKTIPLGAAVGFLNWLGFILVVQLDDWAAAKRPTQLLLINAGSNLVSLVIMGAPGRPALTSCARARSSVSVAVSTRRGALITSATSTELSSGSPKAAR